MKVWMALVQKSLLAHWMVLGLVAAHFALTVLYVLPPNPLKTVTTLPEQYIGKYFYQRWSLFAPNPISTNTNVVVNCIGQGGIQSGPMDVTSPLLRTHMANRLSPMERVLRVPDSLLHLAIYPDESSLNQRKICSKNPKANGCAAFEKQSRDIHRIHTTNLVRAASAVCADLSLSRGAKYQRVTIFAKVQAVAKWSKRYEPPSPAKHVSLGTHNLIPSKAFGIWE